MTPMATLCLCHDVPDSTALRESARDAHFAYIESIMDEVLVAGPLGDPEIRAWRGSAFLYATDDADRARALLHNDPYYQAGVYARVDTFPFLPAAGHWLGGGIWQQTPESSS